LFRNILLSLFSLAFGILLFDALVFLVQPKLIKQLNPTYGQLALSLDLGRGYPSNHFAPHPDRGFDIAPSHTASTSSLPIELGTYKVWGNRFGCFDKKWDMQVFRREGYVYLAGDSFTWGYAPYDRKFGVLLEATLNVPVAKCGVTHTGQVHQFEKFRELYAKIGKPSLVVVNVAANDIANDYFFPHSTVVEGYQVDSVVWQRSREGDVIQKRLDLVEIQQNIKDQREQMNSWSFKLKTIIKTYSATAVLLNALLEKMSSDDKSRRSSKWTSDIYSLYRYTDQYPVDKSIAERNRKAIQAWVDHAELHGYALLFSFIPAIQTPDNFYEPLSRFLTRIGADYVSFEQYIDNKNVDRKSLYWTHDPHLNVRGNQIYARFLAEELQERLGQNAATDTQTIAN